MQWLSQLWAVSCGLSPLPTPCPTSSAEADSGTHSSSAQSLTYSLTQLSSLSLLYFTSPPTSTVLSNTQCLLNPQIIVNPAVVADRKLQGELPEGRAEGQHFQEAAPKVATLRGPGGFNLVMLQAAPVTTVDGNDFLVSHAMKSALCQVTSDPTPQGRTRWSCGEREGKECSLCAQSTTYPHFRHLPSKFNVSFPTVTHSALECRNLKRLVSGNSASADCFSTLFPENKNKFSIASKDLKQWPQAWFWHPKHNPVWHLTMTHISPPLLPTQKKGGREKRK